MKNLDGTIATISDTTSFHVQSCTPVTAPIPDKKIIVSLSNVDDKAGFSICNPDFPANCHRFVSLYTDKPIDINLIHKYSEYFKGDEVRFHIKLWNPGCWGWGLSLQVQVDGHFQNVINHSNKRSLVGGSGAYCDRIIEIDWQYLANKKTGKITLLK